MADREIDLLPAAEQITLADLFLLKQGGVAKKLTGQVLIAFLTALADGHGGISDITKTGTEGLVDTYQITLADGSSFAYGVTNGAKGDKGDNSYTWIKYASQEPTEESHSFGDISDRWMGVYAGPLSAAPEDWTLYTWFKIKGEKGETGDPAILNSSVVSYQVGISASEIPTGEWLDAIPETPQGAYLWSRMVHQFNTGDPVTVYSVSRMGIDGLGTLRTINGLTADAGGDLNLSAASVGALAKTGDTWEGSMNANGHAITGLPTPTGGSQAVPLSLVKGLRRTMWTNSAVASVFAAQDLPFGNPANNQYATVFFFVSTEDITIISSGKLPIPDIGGTLRYRVYAPWQMTASQTVFAYRSFAITRTDEYVVFRFEDAVRGSGAAVNGHLIPYRIDLFREVG